MMNMFIAILGNTYNTVQEEWKRNKYFQKVECIYDLELLMVWNYKTKGKKFLVYGQDVTDDYGKNKESFDNGKVDYPSRAPETSKRHEEAAQRKNKGAAQRNEGLYARSLLQARL